MYMYILFSATPFVVYWSVYSLFFFLLISMYEQPPGEFKLILYTAVENRSRRNRQKKLKKKKQSQEKEELNLF